MSKDLSKRDSAVIWHPYTQMKRWPEAIGIFSGKGALLFDENGKSYIDAISSWWVNLHGHAHPYIAEKIAAQALQLEHCIFAGFTHEPATQLAERLLPILPGKMERIFYSDNGSTAVEVALKMCLQYFSNTGKPRQKIVALEGAYHGDTFGAMSVSARSIFTGQFDRMLFDVDFIPFPAGGNDVSTIDALEHLLAGQDVAAFIVEPLIQGSGGMRMYSPEILEKMFLCCRKYGTLIIADEVMTGFGRTGTLFACDQLNTSSPDLVCLSKGLTGGTMPMGITACTADIYNAFLSDESSFTLYHGHSFTANPLACAAALASLDLLLAPECSESIAEIARLHSHAASRWKGHKSIKDIRVCGTIMAIELETGTETGYLNLERDRIYKHFLDRGIIMRPLGNIIYLLPPYCISPQQLNYLYTEIDNFLNII